MASYISTKLSKPNYHNWVKATLAVLLTKEGIEPFVYQEIQQFQLKCLYDICNDNGLSNGTTCSICCTENVVACPTRNICRVHHGNCGFHRDVATYYNNAGCPSKICNHLTDKIQHSHRYNGPSYKNTDATQWCSNPWEVAKCFMPPDGYKDVTSPAETDFNGINSIVINHIGFQAKITDRNIFETAREIGKKVRHSSTLEINAVTLRRYFIELNSLLSDPGYLANDRHAKEAQQKLLQLQNDTLPLGEVYIKRVLDETAAVIKVDIKNESDNHKRQLKEEHLELLETSKKEIQTLFTDKEKHVYSQIENKLSLAVDEIERKKSKALADIDTKVSDELANVKKEIHKSGNEQVMKVEEIKTKALTDIDTKANAELIKVKEELQNYCDKHVKTVEEIKSKALTDIDTNANDELAKLKEELQTYGDKTVEETKSKALGEVKRKANDEIEKAKSEIQREGDEQVERLEKISKEKEATLLNVAGDTRYDESDIQKTKRAIDKACGNFIDYMEPDPILDCVTEIDLFGYRETRDIKEEKHTTEKNRRILEKVRSKGNTGYEKFKDCLHKTDQSILVKLLECIEREEDTSSLLQQIKEKKTMKDLQDDLISFYRRQHRTIPLSPLIEEDSPLLKFYVMPEIKSLNVKRTGDGVKEEKITVTPFGNVFYNENKICRNIYLTADAGLGKTAFSKRLALTWCHAKNPNTEEGQFFSEEEIQAMHEFRFVFLLLLRDSSSECDIVDLIWTQVVSQLPPRYTRDKLEEILFKERSLVILDGLDEWCHLSDSCKQTMSSIPHQKAWEQTAVLTTTRPWKLSASGLHSSQIDQKLEIMGLNQESANTLKESVISHLCADKTVYEVQQDVKQFTRSLKEKQISDLETIPLLLMYLLFLWCNKIEFGQSQCDLYSQITELLLSRTMQNYQELTPKVDIYQDNIPQCLSQQAHCKEFYSLLKQMGQLAYQTLFRETRIENTLVFDSSVAGDYLNKECLTFCLKTGIISQSKVPGALFPQKSKMSFAHKTVQEYFAALYIRSIPDQTSVQETVLSKCTCVKDILEMSKILIFLSGFNVNVSSSISRELMQIINEDEITREYRSSLQYSEPLKQFQDMCVSCCKELPHDNEVNISLQDVFIDASCEQEQYCENLKQLTSRNKQNIRSLYIRMDGMSRTPYSSAQKVIEDFALSDLENIEKIHYTGEYNDLDILPLLKSSVKSLSLECSESSWSVLLYEKVTSLQNLEAIGINGFKMSHEQLTLLYDYISQRQCMRDIELRGLDCTDHKEDSCTGCCLNLSKHSKLRKILLYHIPVSELDINMSSLEKFELEELSNPDLVLRFINCVPADSKVNRFVCWDLKSSAAIETIQQTLPLLVHVEDVTLCEINLDNRNLLSTEMVNIKLVHLLGVTMPASGLRGIVTVLQQLTQTVTVYILSCHITPESEFVTVKEEIKQSSKFRVSEDSEDGIWKYEFETIKNGD